MHLRGVLLLVPFLALQPLSALAAGSVTMTASGCGVNAFCFQPAAITVPAGGSVTWTNTTGAPHTATVDSGAWTTPTVSPGSSATVSFPVAGTYTYHCNFHSFMRGTVVVTAAVATPAPSATAPPGPGSLASGGLGPLPLLGVILVVLGVMVIASGALPFRRRPR